MTNLHETDSGEDLRELGEFGLIARLSTRLARRGGVRLGIGDDAALLDDLAAPLVTCDCLIEGVHFRRDWTTPRQLGRKALAVNVSDIAAMGGRPVAAFVTLALGPADDLAFVEELYRGLEEAASLYELTIAGGDTARSTAGLMLAVTLIGQAPLEREAAGVAGEASEVAGETVGATQPVTRSGAQAGDALLVTGTLGDAAAGLALLRDPAARVPPEERGYLLARHHDPQARLREAHAALSLHSAAANENGAAPAIRVLHAGLDLSDGLAGDAAHIARCSGVAVEIEAARLPISPPCRAAARALGADALDWALRGGEDYELLWCVAPAAVPNVAAAVRQATGTPVTVVGRCVAPGAQTSGAETSSAEAVVVIDPSGRRRAAPGAFRHF